MPTLNLDVALSLERARVDLAKQGWPDDTLIEHGIEAHLLRHELWLTVPPYALHRIVLFHPEACGCNALPDEIVLHG